MTDAINFFIKADTIEFIDCQCWDWEDQEQIKFEDAEIKYIIFRDCWIESNIMIKKIFFESGVVKNLSKISFNSNRGPGADEIEMLVHEHQKETGLSNYEIIK